jgi:hypothetical protein
MEYKKLKDLNGSTLALRDTLNIAGNNLIVEKDYLLKINGSCSQVFTDLEIEDKKGFCKKYYGYEPQGDGDFPQSKPNDFKALTKVAIALMKLEEKR